MNRSRTLLLFAGLLSAIVAWADGLCFLPDGTPVRAGCNNNVSFLDQWTNGAWAPIAVPAELVPAMGGFEKIASDAQGNLMVEAEAIASCVEHGASS